MRLFIAIPVPEYIREYALSIRKKFEEVSLRVKWVEYENYHITLKFLGEVKPELLKDIQKGLQNAAQDIEAFDLRLLDLTCFPNMKSPRVLVINVGGSITTGINLGNKIDRNLQDLGFAPDNKRRFHLTLGRIRSDDNFQYVRPMFEMFKPHQDIPGFKVNEFHLMESELSRLGPKYSKLYTVKLH
jgi:2'-5' RNA ligase